jgi:hypothetical protein
MKVAVPVASATGRNVRALTSEHDAADRCVECGCDAGAGAGGYKDYSLTWRHAHDLA